MRALRHLATLKSFKLGFPGGQPARLVVHRHSRPYRRERGRVSQPPTPDDRCR
jgi:hypothetical protein